VRVFDPFHPWVKERKQPVEVTAAGAGKRRLHYLDVLLRHRPLSIARRGLQARPAERDRLFPQPGGFEGVGVALRHWPFLASSRICCTRALLSPTVSATRRRGSPALLAWTIATSRRRRASSRAAATRRSWSSCPGTATRTRQRGPRRAPPARSPSGQESQGVVRVWGSPLRGDPPSAGHGRD
jgi:hypothetical protein